MESWQELGAFIRKGPDKSDQNNLQAVAARKAVCAECGNTFGDEKRTLHDRICETRVIRKQTPIGNYTLGQGKDHLLHVFPRFGVEDYKRFYFNDLQAIMTRKTIMGKIQNIAIGCFLLLFVLPAITSDGGKSVFLVHHRNRIRPEFSFRYFYCSLPDILL